MCSRSVAIRLSAVLSSTTTAGGKRGWKAHGTRLGRQAGGSSTGRAERLAPLLPPPPHCRPCKHTYPRLH